MGLLDTGGFVQDEPAPGGLLGQGFADPRSAAIMNLAAGMIQGNFGAGLANASRGYQDAANANIDRLAKTQQIGINNIQLQQAIQKWKWLQDAMNGADQPTTQAAPNPAAPQIALSQGADMQPSLNLPDGSKLNTGGIGPTNANAQRMGAVAPVQVTMPSSNPYVAAGNALGITPKAAIMQSMMFPDAFNKAYGAALTPTDATRLAVAAGLDPRATNAAFARKGGWVAPTNIRGFGYIDPEGLHPLPMNAPQGSMPQQDANGNWSFVPVTGGAAAVQSEAQAKQTGKTLGTLGTGVGPDGKPVFYLGPPPGTIGAPTQTAPTASPASPAVAPAASPAGAQPADADRAAIYAAEIEKTQDMIANPKKYMSPNMLMQDPTGAQFVARAKSDLAGLQNEVAKLSPKPVAKQPSAPNQTIVRPSLSATDQALTDQGGKYYQAATNDASNVGTFRQMLSEINALAANPNNKFGPGAPEFAHALALAKNVGIDLSGAQTAQDIMGKLASNIVMAQLGQGGTGTDAQMNQIIHANPNGEMTNEAIQHVVPLLMQQLDLREARANAINHAVGQSQNFGQIPPVVNQFNKVATPEVASLGMQLAKAQKSGSVATFMRGLTAQQRALLPAVRQLDQIGAF